MKGTKAVGRLLTILVVLYGGWCAALYRLQTRLFFPGAFFGVTAQPELPVGATLARFEHPDGVSTDVVFMPAEHRSGVDDGPTPLLVYLHGNGSIAGHVADDLRRFTRLGIAVAVPEYRGYAGSGGVPSEASVGADLVRVVDALSARSDIDGTRIVYYGRSIGTAFGAQLAHARPPAAMILQTPFLRTDAMALRYGAPPFLVLSPFRADRVAGAFRFPVLIQKHTMDRVAPPSDADALHALIPDSVLQSTTTDHNGPRDRGDLARQQEAQMALVNRVVLSASIPDE